MLWHSHPAQGSRVNYGQALLFEDDDENDDDDENLAPTRRLESVTNKLWQDNKIGILYF